MSVFIYVIADDSRTIGRKRKRFCKSARRLVGSRQDKQSVTGHVLAYRRDDVIYTSEAGSWT